MYWLIVPVVLALLSAAWYPYQSKNTETSQVSLSSILSSPEVLEALSGDPAMLNEQRIKRDRTLFDVVDLPGKGKGAIAVRDILQGELIMQEKPLLTVPVGEITRKQIDTLYTVASAEQISSLLALSWSELKTDKEINLDPATQNEEERYILTEGIIQNNAFGLKIGNEQHLGVCPRMARINHNCASAHNCAYHYRESEGEMRAYAIKNISKGEELSYAYVETRKPRAERQEKLRSSYGFTCSCPICSLPDEESAQSDEKLSQFTPLYTSFDRVYRNIIDGKEAIEIMRALWNITLETDYVEERGRWAQEAAYVATIYADEDAARQWLKLALKWTTIEFGDDSERVESLQFTLDNLKDHPELGIRPKMQVGGPDPQW